MELILRWVVVAICLAYLFVAMKLESDALKHLRDRNRRPFGKFPMFSPEHFTVEGEPLRRRTVRFYRVGGAVVVMSFIVVWALHWLLE